MAINGNPGKFDRQDKAPIVDKSFGQKAANWGTQQALEYANDRIGYRNLTRAFAEARIAFVTRWFWLAEFATLGLMALFAVIDVLLWVNNHPYWGLIMLIPVALAFLLWQLARYLRRLLYRQVTRALAAFDDMIGRGVAKIGDWPGFFLNWRRNHKRQA